MTVCIAAICAGGSTIMGASDRMLSTDTIEFEPNQTKVFPITQFVACMLSGDSTVHAEVMQQVSTELLEYRYAELADTPSVRKVAGTYSRYFRQNWLKRAEAEVLAPVGLTIKSFLAGQRGMDPDFVRQLSADLKAFTPPAATQVIIAGVDKIGAHLWVAHDLSIECYDHVGFAAVGAGAYHANSQFMFSGHTRFRGIPETLSLSFLAKKRGEVAPFVGKTTDMFSISEKGFFPIVPSVIGELEKIYRHYERRIDRVNLSSVARVKKYLDDGIAAQAEKEKKPPEDGPGEPDE